MFLNKHSSQLNKPKNTQTAKPKRILGGWEDEQQTPSELKQSAITQSASLNILDFTYSAPSAEKEKLVGNVSESKDKNIQKANVLKTDLLNWDALNEKNDIQCEKQLVQDLLQPGGIRIKPSQTSLASFAKQIKGMEVSIIGSLLISKLEVNYPFQIKAKALYTMDFLSKKENQYSEYFKKFSKYIQDCPEPQDNAEGYRKIVISVLNLLGIQRQREQQVMKPTFVDPGYNQESSKGFLKDYMQKNSQKPKKLQIKKAIIGPGQAKSKEYSDNRKEQLGSQNSNLLQIQDKKNSKYSSNLLDLDSNTSNKLNFQGNIL